jgi:hypothetical protein
MIPIVDGIIKTLGSWFDKKAADADAGNISAKITSKELKYTKKAIAEAVKMIQLVEREKKGLPKDFIKKFGYRRRKFYSYLAKD